MPNRILREAILDSERVDALSAEAERFYKRLINVVDDYGRCTGDLRVLRSRCFPLRPSAFALEQVEVWMAECSQGEDPLIVRYEVAGKKYMQLQNLGDPRSKKSRFPAPVQSVNQDRPGNTATVEPSPPSELLSGRVAQTPPNTEANTDTDTKAETKPSAPSALDALDQPASPKVSAGNRDPFLAWQTDDGFLRLKAAYEARGACPGGDALCESDWGDAYRFWRALDFEQRLAAVQGIEARTDQEPQYFKKPAKYLQSPGNFGYTPKAPRRDDMAARVEQARMRNRGMV